MESSGESPPGKRTAVMLDVRPMLNAEEFDPMLPLTIDPVSMRPEALPLNVA